ncbi:hypothetical protein N7481_011735 [Penicillium waksmanii]|uniref:uncharacterized protein n=1 Tax=Penicillium waksmanii TaxID=69791 RepID=UPI002546BC2F|nr:uncharacterized protein N7481_011735 [Penicillium waksmanii]KAJ5974525.1 hypothetical protein N7481_011735 [Penicillium waksmanii]
MTERSASEKTAKSKGDAGRDARAKDSPAASAVKSETTGSGSHSSSKKRRKVNHGELSFARACDRDSSPSNPPPALLRGSDRPVSTVVAREPTKRRDQDDSTADEPASSNNDLVNVSGMPQNVDVSDAAGQQILPDGAMGMPPSTVQPASITSSGQGLNATPQPMMAYDNWMGGQNQFQDMHSLHPSYMFNAPEVTNEYNLLGDFLSNSLLDDGAIFPDQNMNEIYSDPSLINSMTTLNVPNGIQPSQLAPPTQSQAPPGDSIQRPTSTVGNDKARETYYMTAADPSGSDPPEERMNKLLKAKYDAGLLKPFNYVKGYARLNQYMEKNMHQSSRQKILRQLDKFRPKFRERMQSLTDIELILVEMWFERSLMEYDRVFASMAIPACCWRRTGEIFRGNNEMAQLIDVPIESLRDGKLAIHEIIVEDQLVSYWEKFGAIAFDNTQKAMLTSCTLKSPKSDSTGEGIQCCFSFTIRRDNHNIPSMIVAPNINLTNFVMTSHPSPPSVHAAIGKTEYFPCHIKILKVEFAAARSSMEADQLDSALKILEASAQRLDSLKSPARSIDQAQLHGIVAEYYMLRVRLEFLKCRPDIADHLFARAPIGNRLGNRDLVIETCYNAGIDALGTDLNAATMWLQRAVEQVELSIAKIETSSGDIGIWNIRCRATLVRAYLATKNVSRRKDIEKEMENLKRSNSDALSVMVLEIEVIRQDETPDCQRLLEVDVKSIPCEQCKYPDDELEYLAVRAFNQALNYFAEGKDKDCKRWASKSTRLAEGMGDQKGASLAEDFRGRLKTCLS